ncbi:MAG: AraC family transcriptional regulator [Alphaproteobacteria bacterium]|nr:MAG: AraC family transcriptional regulator [Alphaproteobacteria bacterium]
MHDVPAHAFEFVPAPADLAPYLNSLYVLRIAPQGLKEMLPAYSGQLLISNGPSGRLDFGHGFVEAKPRVTVVGPLSHASPLEIDGPACILGVSMSFYGWAALTGLPAASHGDRFLDVGTALGEAAGTAALQLSADFELGKIDARAALDKVADILRSCAAPLPDQHRFLIETTYNWLSSSFSPPSEELYAKLPMSPRQAQRLVNRFFGLPPHRLMRRYRAIRAATLLADPKLDPALRAEVLNSFYDQAHMIREIREFAGRTPRLLVKGGGSIVQETLREDGYGVVDVFAGNEAEQLAKYGD